MSITCQACKIVSRLIIFDILLRILYRKCLVNFSWILPQQVHINSNFLFLPSFLLIKHHKYDNHRWNKLNSDTANYQLLNAPLLTLNVTEKNPSNNIPINKIYSAGLDISISLNGELEDST